MISVEQKLFLAKVIKVGGIKGKQHLSFISLRTVYKGYSQRLSFTALLALLDKYTSKKVTAIARKLQSPITNQPIIIKSCLISGLLKSSTHYLLIGLIISLLWILPHSIKHQQLYRNYAISI